MRKLTFLAWTVVLIQSGCEKSSQGGFDCYRDGTPMLISALIINTFDSFPLGKPSKVLIDSIERSALFQSFSIPSDNILEVDSITTIRAEIKLTPAAEYIAGGSNYIARLYKDTVTFLRIDGTSDNRSHIDATVKMISSRFGEPSREPHPERDHYYTDEHDYYTWNQRGYNVSFFFRVSNHYYSLWVSDTVTRVYDELPEKYKHPL